jgi:hypothetical protein
VPFTVVAGCITVYVVTAVAITVAHARHPVYQLPDQAVATVLGAGLVTIPVAAVTVKLRRPGAALVVAITISLFMLGLLAIFSIGLLLLVGSVILLLPVARLLRGASAAQAGTSVLTGALLGLGLVVVWVVSSQPPIVGCSSNGVSESTRAWWGGSFSGTSSGRDTVDLNGAAHGTITTGGHTYTYSCTDGQLDKFTVASSP